MMKCLLSSPSSDDFSRLLRAWRFWFLGALLGALLGAAAFFVFPPDYRAQATVVVDFNVEEEWTEVADRKIFYHLERESRKVEEVAWSDETVGAISQEIVGLTVANLRNERLRLSQPQDGGWHFYADDPDPARAAQIASLWAESFTEQVHEGAASAMALQALQTDLAYADDVQDRILMLEEASFGISPYVQVYLSQKDGLPVTRKIALGEYVFFGAMSLLFVAVLFVLFFGKSSNEV